MNKKVASFVPRQFLVLMFNFQTVHSMEIFSIQKLHQGFISTVYGVENIENSFLASVCFSLLQILRENYFLHFVRLISCSDIFSNYLVPAAAGDFFD